MTYLLIAIGENNVVWLWRRKREKMIQSKTEQAEAIKLEIQRKAKLAAKEAKEVNELMKHNPGGIAELLVYATGNNRRGGR